MRTGNPPGASPAACPPRGGADFTLLELMMVMTLLIILASLVVPTYRVAMVRARESVLREDLYTLRNSIDQYTLDKQRPPATLDDLVEEGYLRTGMPVDPLPTRSNLASGYRGRPLESRPGDVRCRGRAQRIRRHLAGRDALQQLVRSAVDSRRKLEVKGESQRPVETRRQRGCRAHLNSAGEV